MKYQKLNESLKFFIKKFNEVKHKKIKIISHLDADGITSASILKRAFERENLNFSILIVRQVDKELLKQLDKEETEVLFFSDLGSSSISTLNVLSKKSFILDHHILEKDYEKFTNLMLINPQIYDLDPKEISGAGLTYLFAKELNKENIDLAYLAIIGAIGDICEEDGKFKGLNLKILDDAISSGKIKKTKSLRLFGASSRPLNRSLEYSTDPHIPGITGSGPHARLLLEELNLKDENGYKKLIDLSEEELKSLASEIIVRRIGSHDHPENIFGHMYILTEEDDDSQFREAHEFSTFLNACGRLGESSVGIDFCLGNKNAREKISLILANYKKEIVNAIKWFHNNRNNTPIKETEKYIIIDAKNEIKDTIIGPLSSILIKSSIFEKEIILLSLAYSGKDKIKISMRASNPKVNVKEILESILSKFAKKEDLEVGGHMSAAGALIPLNMEENLIKNATEVLNKL